MVSRAHHPRNADATRQRLLDAACLLFGRQGFEATGVRDIADEAGVNSALVGRHFGSKRQLFAAVLGGETLSVAPLLEGDRSMLGLGLAHRTIGDEISGGASDPLLLMLRSANQPVVAPLLRDALTRVYLAPLAQCLGGRLAAERAEAIIGLLIGGGFLHRLLWDEQPRDAQRREALIVLFGRLIQPLVDA